MELIVDPDSGTWHTVGDNGAEFTAIPTGAIVFNHKQTEALLKYGKVAGRGRALAEGTAMVSASGNLWNPSSGSSSGSGSNNTAKSSGTTNSSSSYVSKQDITDAVEEGTRRGIEDANETPDDSDIEFIASGAFEELRKSSQAYNEQLEKENNMLLENNAVNEKLINYLKEQNFGFTEEELQAILDEAHSLYGEPVTEQKKNNLSLYGATYADALNQLNNTNPASTSYAMRMRSMNNAWSTVSDGNIEKQFGYKLSDSAYTKQTIRDIIEMFFKSISMGSAVNFSSVDDLKAAIENALYNPDALLKDIMDYEDAMAVADRIITQNHYTGEKAESIYKRRVGEYYNRDNSYMWTDILGEKLDELFSGDWYETLTTEQYRSYTTSDMLSSGVEDLIEIFFDRLERRIERLDNIISSSFKDIETRSSASYDKIELLTKELADKQKAAEIYKEAAESINISEEIKQALRDGDLRIEDLKGTMSIDQSGSFSTTFLANGYGNSGSVISMGEPDKDADAESVFKENVSKYQDYYEKYLDTIDDLADIQEEIAEAYKDRFDNIQDDFDNQISLLDHEANTYSTLLEQIQDSGYRAETGYYDILKGIEQERYDLLVNKYDTLRREYDAAMASGEIDYGSEAWYDLIGAINDTEEAMQKVTSQMIEYTNKARELLWEVFDSRQERINILIDQNEFLMDLIDDSNIFDKDGRVTQKGVAYVATSLDNLRKNLKMAKNYGEELANIIDQLHSDPSNQKLREREQELREKQQQSILAAKKSAQAINDIELKSLKNLISNYEEAMSKQKEMRDYQRKLKDQTEDISNIRKQIEVFSNDTSEDAKRKVQELQKKLKDAEENLQDTQYDHYLDMQKEMFDDLYEEYEESLNNRFDDLDGMLTDMTNSLSGKVDDISETLHTIAEGVGYIIQFEIDKDSLGDIDFDGRVTTEDARLAMRAGVGFEKLTDRQKAVGDLDGDGVVNSSDARAIMRVATKIDTIEQYLEALGIVGYSGGGLVNKTGLAMLHGTASDPEIVLNANDSQNLIGLRDTMREMTRMDLTPLGMNAKATSAGRNITPSIGEIQINIPIDKVEDYEDFFNKMKTDDRFGKLIRAASVDLLNGYNSMRMYQI